MDTRTKIVSVEQAAELARECRRGGMQVALVTGYFDPLLDAHARRLGEIAAPGRAVFVAIAEPPRPLLQARARAELVAALAMVDYVMLAASMPADWFAALVPDAVFREEAADERRTGDLIKHVQSRQT